MSSHHIVREKQEPALLALRLNTFDPELLGQLLEWSPTVICTPTTAEQINAYGIKIDIIVADELVPGMQSDVKLIPTGNGDVIKAALGYLIAAGYGAVNIITDAFVLGNFEAYADKINEVIFCGERKIFPVKNGFKKWKPAGEIVELLTAPSNLKTDGLNPISDGIYQTAGDGFYTLQFEDAFLFVTERV